MDWLSKLFYKNNKKSINMDKNVLNFEEAKAALKEGKKVKLPEWTGYWFQNPQGHIQVFTKHGEVLNTPDYDSFGSRNDWQIHEGGLGFDFAINALKNGKLVRRAGWNGKGMFVFMRPGDKLQVETVIEKVKSLPDSVKEFYKQGVQDHDSAVKMAEANPSQGETSSNSPKGLNQFVDFKAYFCLYSVDGSIFNGWVPSTGDCLAEDWELAD
jgi:hypothetical protein